MKIEPAGAADRAALLALWERSVRATHDFLAEEDVIAIREAVRAHALPALELWLARDGKGAPVGFMGLAGNSVETLFIDPDWFGRGLGRAFLNHARALRGPLRVDVNEQNPGALAFYRKCGFVETGRSAVDSDGRPFPIIHLAESAAEKESAT
ncbi:acetyltransferase [Amphiplicatus metriothermophilus]|uniref:Putative acetyltransferase n=1 Tax=Amphiplicatus metriothermophilus TaxID=1519374 RepID=A0A239PKA7_9PROT|nr:acetyltransferase [Amphiplicatus metriothermophilus]MBB5517907.1 putative acetyltransferase [Amphiplicatus metriothermophilus]SNT67759.1 putative acetyltransferase [Amphiplicatus metriothermophilus]